LDEKDISKRLIKELKLMKKTKSYFEMHDLMIFYDRIIKLFLNYKDKVKIVELNEDPFIKEEEFPINLSSFILYINNFEYLLFIELEEVESFKISDLKSYFSLFSNYYNKRGFFIIWNDNNLSAIYIDYIDIYTPIKTIFDKIKMNVESFDKVLESRLKRVPKKKFRMENIDKIDLDIKNDLERVIKDKFESYLNNIKKLMQKTYQKFDEREIIERIILLFDDFFNSEIESKELKERLLRLYNFRK